MGEYVMTTITIGGLLPGEAGATALIAAATAYYAEADTLVREALAAGRHVDLEDLQDHGRTPDLDAFCRANGLAYQRAWVSQIGQFEAGLEYWQPGMDQPVEEAADEGGEPIIALAELRRCHRGGETLTSVVARLGPGGVGLRAAPDPRPAGGRRGPGFRLIRCRSSPAASLQSERGASPM